MSILRITMENFIIKYISVQDSLLATINDFNNLVNDVATNMPLIMKLTDRFEEHKLSFNYLKVQLGKIKNIPFKSTYTQSLQVDENIINFAMELVSHITKSSTEATTGYLKTMDFARDILAKTIDRPFAPAIDFVEVMKSYLGDVGSSEMLHSEVLQQEDFKYQVEFEISLRINMSDINLYRGVDLNRLHCMSIILQAFFLDNVEGLDFKQIKENDTPLKRQKIICLFSYFITMFGYMNRQQCLELYKPIVIQHASATFDDIELIRTVNKFVDVSKINVEEFSKTHKYYKYRSFKSYDLIVDYADQKLGSSALTDSANYEDIMFMKYPELYGVSYIVNRNKDDVFGDTDSYLISNIIQFNIVENAQQESRQLNSAADLFGIIFVNIVVFESCDLKTHLGSFQSEKSHLDRMILKLYSGLLLNRNSRRINNNNEDQPDACIRLHAGAGINDCTDNKTFQFLIEVLVCSVLNYELCYCVRSSEQLSELNDTVEALGYMDVAQLYFRLVNYDFETTGPINFRTETYV